jgi:serine/threonine protein kinase
MKKPKFDLEPGLTLGPNYYIVEFLGGGWEGEVYKVEERKTGIMRAAKLFYPHRNVRQVALLRYARKLYKLRSCPIVIQYHHRGFGRVRSQQIDFLVSDLAEGEMLSTFLERQNKKRLPPFEALHLMHALAVGMEPIHFMGEYHGDIHTDNIMVQRKGLGFEVHLLDFFHLGRATRENIQWDIFDMINVLYEMIGGDDGYRKAGNDIKQIIRGRKRSLIRQRIKTAAQLRLALDNIDWEQ